MLKIIERVCPCRLGAWSLKRSIFLEFAMFSVRVPLVGLIKMVWGRGRTRQRGKSLKPAGPDGMSVLGALACATAPGASPGLPGAQGPRLWNEERVTGAGGWRHSRSAFTESRGNSGVREPAVHLGRIAREPVPSGRAWLSVTRHQHHASERSWFGASTVHGTSQAASWVSTTC